MCWVCHSFLRVLSSVQPTALLHYPVYFGIEILPFLRRGKWMTVNTQR